MREQRLYFLSAGRRIKIGISVNVAQRRAQIQRGMRQRVRLLGHVAGGFGFERHVHRLLEAHSLGGEWFADVHEVRDVMNRVLAGDPVGFQEPPAIERVEREQTPEEFHAMFSAFASMAFPGDTAGEFADQFELERADVERWLSGQELPPAVVATAFAGHFVAWALARHKMRNVRVRPR